MSGSLSWTTTMGMLGLVALAFGSTGCAYMFRGSKQTVELGATPKGAEVRNGGELLGAAPVQAELSRDRDQALIFSKEGHTPGRLELHRRPSTGWFVWDIATCVIPVTLCIPVLADGISGAWFEFEDAYVVKLPVASTTPPSQPPQPPSPPRPGEAEVEPSAGY